MKILALPRDTNPYQELLYKPLRAQDVTVEYLEEPTGSHTLNLFLLPFSLTRKRLQGFDTVHVHWTYPFWLPFGGVIGRAIMEVWAASFWLLVRLYGMRLVWTAHNVLPHEQLFLNDKRAHRFLGCMASRIIVHTKAAKQQLIDLGIPSSHMRIIPHGSYIGVYPDTVTKAQARQKLDIPKTSTVLLFFGLIRPYKGIEQLLEAFAELSKKTDVVLLVAGSVQDETLQAVLEAAALIDTRVHLLLRHIPDEELQYLFRAADFTVLPYEKSTTSGVSLLACSFGCSPIVPRQAAFADIPAKAQLNYAKGHLQGALIEALAMSSAKRAVQSKAAFAYARQLSWESIATQTREFLA
jgi:glycosyltransferase involved in cell wall biosynthesis